MVPELQQKPINNYISYRIIHIQMLETAPHRIAQAPSKEQAVIPQQLKGWMMIYDCCQAGGMMQIMTWYIEYIERERENERERDIVFYIQIFLCLSSLYILYSST